MHPILLPQCRRDLSRVLFLFALLCCTTLQAADSATAVKSWELARTAVSFDRHYLTNPTTIEAIRKTGNLAGKTPDGKGVSASGWFEYDFSVPAAGWYELFVDPSAGNHEITLDNTTMLSTSPANKTGNFWLATGKHTLRIQRLYWTGLGAITGWKLSAVNTADALRCFRIDLPANRTLIRAGEPLIAQVQSGALPRQSAPVQIEVQLRGAGDKVTAQAKAAFHAGDAPQTVRLALTCPAGEQTLRVLVNGRLLTPQEWPAPRILALDVTPSAATGRELRKELIAEIDCAATAPDYFGGGDTRVQTKSFGAYRESGELGWLQFMDATNPGWFAYKFAVPQAQKPYYFEVDYPDDARRTFCLAVREAAPGAYPTTAGADTGGEFSLSGGMQTQGILHWARGKDLRLLCITPQTGYRAAAARIRLYRLPDGLPQLRVPSFGGRGFGNWYEEGGSLMGIYAAPSGSLAGAAVAAQRWAESIAYIGGDTLLYTMAVYQFGLYPSRYNVSFSSPYSADVVGSIVLACEKYGLKFIGEFHPEARELDWPAPSWDGQGALGAEWPDNHSYSRDGKRGERLLNPLHPRNRAWYADMIGEFAERYKDSPAFKGASLRLMEWVNPGLNNFQSADWGYDDCTVGLFSRETGKTPDAAEDDPARFRKRYDWLKKNAWQEWLDWRSAKITEIHAEIARRVRAARTDLQVFINGDFADLRGAGIDTAALAKIPGVVLMGGGAYGRRGRSLEENYRLRDDLIDPAKLTRLCAPGQAGAYLFGAGYFEATGLVVPPEAMGFDPKTKRTWISGVVNPAGRNYLERYALALAENDAQFLSDGGNAYTLGQPLLREFLAEYRNLPPLPFTPREDARDPVAVWEHRDGRDLYFYMVNRENYPVTVTLKLEGTGQLNRLATAEAVQLKNGALTVTLPAYGLLTYSASPSYSIKQVTTILPPQEAAKAQRVCNWLTQEASAAQTRPDLDAAQKSALREAADTAARELTAGHLWRVRTLCEATELQRIFMKTFAYPPLTYPRPELGPLSGRGNYNKWAKDYPQADLNQPGALAAQLSANGKPGLTATVPGQEYLGPLATWTGAEAKLSLTFRAPVPQRFRLWARLAVGAGCANIAVVNGKDAQPLTPKQSPEPASGLVVRTAELSLEPGTRTLTLRTAGEGQVYLDQLYLEPLFSPVEPLAFAAYFPNPSQSNWEKQLAPETAKGASADAIFPGTDGKAEKQVRWEPYPAQILQQNHNLGANNAWGQVRCPPGPMGKEVVGYCRAVITAPSARTATMSFGASSQVRIFLNDELLVDSMQEKLNLRWNFGLHSRQIKLKAGENILLVKVGNAGDTNPEYVKLVNFHAAITDPGDLTITSGLNGK